MTRKEITLSRALGYLLRVEDCRGEPFEIRPGERTCEEDLNPIERVNLDYLEEKHFIGKTSSDPLTYALTRRGLKTTNKIRKFFNGIIEMYPTRE